MIVARRRVAVALIAIVSACGGESGPTGPVGATSVIVTGALSVETGRTIQLVAVARDANSTTIGGKSFTWSSSSDAIATVASDGTVTGKATGAVTITASADGKSGSLPITVIVAVATVAISGATSSQVGQTTQLTALATDATGAVVTAPVTWSSSDQTLIGIAGDGTVTATRIGSVTITAKIGSATATSSFTTSLSPYTFSFPAGFSPADQQIIRDGVQYAHAYHQTVFNRVIQQATTVSASLTAAGCSQGGSAAFTGAKAVTFCVNNPGWTQNQAVRRQKIVQHELFHVWQFEYKWLGGPPATTGAMWVIEGSAELMGYKGLDPALLTFSTAIGCQVKETFDFKTKTPPGLPALSAVESPQAFTTTQGPLYAESMLAMDKLTTTPGLVSLKVYTDALAAGTPWQSAFQAAFGTSTADFYASYPAYRSGQTAPPAFLCGI